MEFLKKQRFVLSDGRMKNSYGFTIPTGGIDTRRFEANPVMLNSHWNDTDGVIGRWDDLQHDKKTDQLTAIPVFDKSDTAASKIADKVKAGFIKGASIGISFKREDLQYVGSELTLTKCELMEASIVAIPSNSNALRLYADGMLLEDQEVKNMCLEVGQSDNFNNEPIPNNKTMEKTTIQLSLTALALLGFEAAQFEKLQADDINRAVMALADERNNLKTQVDAYKKKEQEAADAENARLAQRNATLVDDAIKAGKITAAEREHYMKMAAFDYAMTEKHLKAEAGKGSLGAGINPITGKDMTMDEFEKLDTDAKLRWKNENPEGYKKMVK